MSILTLSFFILYIKNKYLQHEKSPTLYNIIFWSCLFCCGLLGCIFKWILTLSYIRLATYIKCYIILSILLGLIFSLFAIIPKKSNRFSSYYLNRFCKWSSQLLYHIHIYNSCWSFYFHIIILTQFFYSLTFCSYHFKNSLTVFTILENVSPIVGDFASTWKLHCKNVPPLTFKNSTYKSYNRDSFWNWANTSLCHQGDWHKTSSFLCLVM